MDKGLNNKLNVNFNLRKPKAQVSTINLVLRYNSQKMVYPTGESVPPANWETRRDKKGYQRAKPGNGFTQVTELNSRLDYIANTAVDVFRKYRNDHSHQVPTLSTFKTLLDIAFERKRKMTNDFLAFVECFIEEAKDMTNIKTGRKLSPLTIKKYKTTLNHLEEYCAVHRLRITFEELNIQFYHSYSKFLLSKNLAANSVGKDITVLKKFFTIAEDYGLLNSTVRRKFKSTTEEADNIYLNESELSKIYNLDLSGEPTLEKVRDLFLIGCYTGLRFSDYSRLTKDNIEGFLISIETYKTGEKVKIPLHPMVKAIFEKYNYSLPKSFSNQRTNQYLKIVGEKVPELNCDTLKKITKGGTRLAISRKKFQLITTHTARRSFATNLHLLGVPSITIMKITGHRTESAFMKYIKITPEDAAMKLAQHWQIAA